MPRGNLNTITQTQPAQLSGGSFATKLITTDNSARVTGNLLKSDAHGNVVDAGVSASGISSGTTSATPILDDSGIPIFIETGEWVFPG